MYDTLLIASVLVFAATVVAYLRHPAASTLHPASWYLLFHGFVFVIRPIFARYYNFEFVYRLYDFQPSREDKITVILGANLALLVFVAVALAIASKPAEPAPAQEFAKLRQLMFWPITITAAILSPLGISAQIYNWSQRATDFDAMVVDAATGTQMNVQGTGWFTDSALMMAPLAVLIVWLARYRWWGWLYFAGFAVLQAGSGTRAPLIFAALAICVTFLLERNRRWFAIKPLLLMLVVGFAFNQIVLDRGETVRVALGLKRGAEHSAARELAPLEHMDFANLEYFEYIVYAVPQRTGTWDYFANNLQVLTEPVPRTLWKGKPRGSPVRFFNLWDYGSPSGMTASLPGVGWMSLGYIGIIIQTAFFAGLFAVLYNWLLVRRRDGVARLLYALCIAMTLIVFRDGTTLTFFRLVPFYLGPFLATLLLAKFAGVSFTGTRRVGPQTSPVHEFLRQTPAERRRALAMQAASQSERRTRPDSAQ